MCAQIVPEVGFAELGSLSEQRVDEIKRKGCVVIRDVVDDAEAKEWQAWLREYVSKNPDIEGTAIGSFQLSEQCTNSICFQASPRPTSSSSSSSEHRFVSRIRSTRS